MGILEDALRTQEDAQLKAERSAREATAKAGLAWANKAQERWPGLDITLGGPLEVIRYRWSSSSQRDFTGSRSYMNPEVLTVPYHLLVEGEVTIANVYVATGATREDHLVRRCPRCSLLGTEVRSFSAYVGTGLSDDVIRERFVAKLGQHMAQEFLCAFCKAAEEGSVCPTCRRPFE